MESMDDGRNSAPDEGDLIRSFNNMTLEFSGIPVIKSKRRLSDISEITKVGELEYLALYDIYTSWMNLNPKEKKKYRRRYQEALKPRSLVYINKTSPESIPKNVFLQFTADDYDWEETDLVETLEKMYWVYEPQYWKSFQSHKFKYVGRGAPRYLFMGFIDWNIAKSKTDIEENFERIEDWLEAIGVPTEDSMVTTDLIRDLVKSKGSYIDPITGRVMPKISLWVFFTQDQNPKKYTGGKIKALARDGYSPSSNYDGSVNIITEDDDGIYEMETKRVLERIERDVEQSFENSIKPDDTPETIQKKRKIADFNRMEAIKKTFFKNSSGNYINIGKGWSYPKINKKTQTISLIGRVPVMESGKKEIIRERAKANLVNLKEIYDKGYLLPPLKREATIIASKDDLFRAIKELNKYNSS